MAVNRKHRRREDGKEANGESMFSFTPKIDKKSKSIAEAKLNKNVKHYDQLLMKGKESEEKIKRISEEQAKKINDNCTFKPIMVT